MRTVPQPCGPAAMLLLLACLLAGGVAAGLSGSRIDQLTGELDISTDQCVGLCGDFQPAVSVVVLHSRRIVALDRHAPDCD